MVNVRELKRKVIESNNNAMEISWDTFEDLREEGELVFEGVVGDKAGGINIADNRPRIKVYEVTSDLYVTHYDFFAVRYEASSEPNEDIITEFLRDRSRDNRNTAIGGNIEVVKDKIGIGRID